METNCLDDILHRIQQRDMNALEILYKEMKGCVYGLAFMYTGSHSDSEDIVQNTFLQIWNRADTYKNDKPKAWIMTVARNLSIDTIRQNSIRSELDENIRSSDDFSEIFDKDTLKTLLSVLSEDEREIILLYSYGFSHGEIAKITGRPSATVRWKYSSSIKKLRKISGGDDSE